MWGCWVLSFVLRGREATKRQAVRKYLSSCYLANSFGHSEWVWRESRPLFYSIFLIYFLFILTLYINAHSYTSSGQNWIEHSEKCQHGVCLLAISCCNAELWYSRCKYITCFRAHSHFRGSTESCLSAAARQEFRWDNSPDAGKLSPCYTDFRAHHCVPLCWVYMARFWWVEG